MTAKPRPRGSRRKGDSPRRLKKLASQLLASAQAVTAGRAELQREAGALEADSYHARTTTGPVPLEHARRRRDLKAKAATLKEETDRLSFDAQVLEAKVILEVSARWGHRKKK